MGFLYSLDLDDNKTAAVIADLQNASQPVDFASCAIQRSLSVLFLFLILCGTLIQLAVVQFCVTVNLLACDNVGYNFNVKCSTIKEKNTKSLIFYYRQALLQNNHYFTSYYVIQPYGLILALNRLIIVVVRVHKLSDIAQHIHKFANCTLWSLAIPPILAAFDPTCHILYVVYSYQRLPSCIYDNMINGLFSLSYKFMQITFIVYLLLVVGLIYHRSQLKQFANKSPHANRKLMSITEWRILLTAFTFASSVLMMAFNKPLRSIFYETYSLHRATVHPANASALNNTTEHRQCTSC
ncbi:hypothetical protein M3Y98_00919900 [Aphelenchoides besseyi]|nr:hypothetical protein M3Y98_00919900 [Aphelenchoides besseyi]